MTWIAGGVIAAAGVTILVVDATRGGNPGVALRLTAGGARVGGTF